MAREVHQFTVIVPAGTLKTAPVIFNLPMPPRTVDELAVRIPPGPRGEVGFAIGASGVVVMPYQVGAFIVGDNETIRWPLENQIDSGAWQLQAYNTGAFNHSLYVVFLCRIPAGQTSDFAGFVPIDPAALA